MKIKTIIALISLGIMTVSCGKDDRIVLSSQSEDHLVIPEGGLKGTLISRNKLGASIARQLNSVSEVYDLSMEEHTFTGETIVNVVTLGISTLLDDSYDEFYLSFTAKTPTGKIYTGIRCSASSSKHTLLIYKDCANNKVIFKKGMTINKHDILANNS